MLKSTWLLILCLTIFLFSCKHITLEDLSGEYIDEHNVVLKLTELGTFELEIPKSPLDIDQSLIKKSGFYTFAVDEWILIVSKSNEPKYSIQVPPLTKNEGLEFRISGENWGGLSKAKCKIEQNGKIIQKSVTDKQGIVKFEHITSGILIIEKEGWGKTKININELPHQSLMITLKKEKDIKIDYVFEIENETLVVKNIYEKYTLQKKRGLTIDKK